jgi:hypothetical protein
MKCNLDNRTDILITSEKLEKNLKLTKNSKSPREDNINLELHTYAPEQFKMRLLQFLNNTSTKKNCTANEWRNVVAISI